MTILLIEIWKEVVIIFSVCVISSFMSSKIGMIIASIITLFYISLTILFVVGGVPGSEKLLILGFFVYPTISWSAFFIGRRFRSEINNDYISL